MFVYVCRTEDLNKPNKLALKPLFEERPHYSRQVNAPH
jgi:hypothetical protein